MKSNAAGRRDRNAVRKDDVAANSKRWVSLGDGKSIRKRRTGGHESSGRKRASTMQLCNGTIDA
jgi:hypothetical protein